MKKLLSILSVFFLSVIIFALQSNSSVDCANARLDNDTSICAIEMPSVSCVATLTDIPVLPATKVNNISVYQSSISSERLQKNQIICCAIDNCYKCRFLESAKVFMQRNIFSIQVDYNIYRLCRLLI